MASSWLTPARLEDASRVLRGVALVLARATADSAQHRAALQQVQAAASAAAAALRAQGQAAAAAAPPPLPAGVNPLVAYLYPHTVQQQQQLVPPLAPLTQPAAALDHAWSAAAAAAPAATHAQTQGAVGWQHQQHQHQQHQQQHPEPALQQQQQHAAQAAASSSTADVPAAEQPQQQQPEHIDSWISGHESVTTQAEESVAAAPAAAQGEPSLQQQREQQPPKVLRERRVPSTQLGRALGFAGMGASLLLGSLTDSISRTLGGSGGSGSGEAPAGEGAAGAAATPLYSSFISSSNAERLAAALCRMRGAALKIGQMLSIQDEAVLPPQVAAALERVRAGADVMPRGQLEGQLQSQLGPGWQERLAEFDWTPRAAASIGQVHAARLHDGRQVAMKVQYPGVARSIESDVDNLMRLVSLANILPKGLYVESAVKVAKRELALECNYEYEAAAQARFRALLAADPELSGACYVPEVIPELSSRQVLTTEWVAGVAIDKVAALPQAERDAVGSLLLRLTLRELYAWRFMQTDPNWGNFLYDPDTRRVNLIDFGAAKEYPRSFVDDYLRMVHACAQRDREGVLAASMRLGFLTGDESAVMLDAHTEAGFVVGLPFATPGVYDFGSHGGLTPRVAELGAVMLKHRLTPPPEESYSLHRKLSGAFLACMKLRARVPCRELFMQTYEAYDFGGSGEAAGGGSASADEADVAARATA